jgi:hypothetical protein
MTEKYSPNPGAINDLLHSVAFLVLHVTFPNLFNILANS